MHILKTQISKYKLVEALPKFQFMIEEYFLSQFKTKYQQKIERKTRDGEESRETMRWSLDALQKPVQKKNHHKISFSLAQTDAETRKPRQATMWQAAV